jgi:hypothetical protein
MKLKVESDLYSMDDIMTFVTTKTENLTRRGTLLRLSKNKEELQEAIIEQATKGANGV